MTVQLGAHTQQATVSDDGRWSLQIAPPSDVGPHVLQIGDGQTSLTINDVLVGEVWLCSGQSNMAMTVSRAQDFETEQAAADLPPDSHVSCGVGPRQRAAGDLSWRMDRVCA